MLSLCVVRSDSSDGCDSFRLINRFSFICSHVERGSPSHNSNLPPVQKTFPPRPLANWDKINKAQATTGYNKEVVTLLRLVVFL